MGFGFPINWLLPALVGLANLNIDWDILAAPVHSGYAVVHYGLM